MVVNASVDMTGVAGYPSAREGWGRTQLDRAVPFLGSSRGLIISDCRNQSACALATGQSRTIDFWAGNCDAPLRVTMTYHDAPALANAASAPINNLNLVVTSPSGVVYRGNHFIGGVSAPNGPPGAADAINNLEQVLVAAPEPGHWTISVMGAAVNQGLQGFAVVITGAVDNNACPTSDFNCDGDFGTDADLEAFFNALAGGFGDTDINRDGDAGTDSDIESFFSILAGGPC
jgi:hypothetical protein